MKKMKARVISTALAVAMGTTALAGCGDSKETKGTAKEKKENAEAVLEFYHGYYHEESEWPAAKVMRDIYEEFAKSHADGKVKFKPIAVENRDDIVSSQVAGGSFPDLVDCGTAVPQAAIAQELVLDMKPYIDKNNLKDAVGLNYTQNDIDGHIYSVHDQMESRGMWYNQEILDQAGVTLEDLSTWDGYEAAMEKVRALGGDTYGYAAGQGSIIMFNAMLASTEEGRELLESEMTQETIESKTFQEAFMRVAKMDQANGSDHTVEELGNVMDDFNKKGTMAVLPNGVWNASGIDESMVEKIQPTIFPENVALSSAGSGLTISSGLSAEEDKLALEFIKYMTSEEVQSKIFTEVQANPCNTTLDLNKLAEESGNAATIKLAEACTLVNDAEYIAEDLNYVWGSDVRTSMINALMECAVSGTDIDSRFEQLQKELTALIG